MATHTSTRKLPALFAALGMAIALALSQVPEPPLHGLLPRLLNTVIGIGGRDDPDAANIPHKLRGEVIPDGYAYVPLSYPASLDMIGSVRTGMPALHQLVTTTPGKVIVVSYSEGSLLAEQEKRNLRGGAGAPKPQDLSFLEIAAPFIPNGGIFARFPGVGIPLMIPGMGPAQPSAYDTTYVTNEYDTYADFPAYFNPLALLNSLAAVAYAHPDAYYDSDDIGSPDNYVKVVKNPAGGTDTYVLIPSAHLPLLAPVRQAAAALRLTEPAERLLGAVEPVLKVMVDMAYTDRQNLNPEVHQPFSMVTPPHKVAEALAATPRALREGLDNLLGRNPKKPAPVTTTTTATAGAARGPTDMTDGNKVSPTTFAGTKPADTDPVKTPPSVDGPPEPTGTAPADAEQPEPDEPDNTEPAAAAA
ncbi:PE-PPE domain-containing protein [Mycolicibacterium cosmeticum]|uniref:PE-PPE-like protein n=1 Tax=Mycolicibacterium cosmeticum TaxID=258533 RepID=W9BKE4_MYCCO|nr:PE-PPE domain-containing protein [Mycolicibacterium cosmeticum]TLH80526.1 PE-PPE domain-containing protein [Mycolicibacterium cosmeticum]CDO07755.1 PE-PPE-like protein [Mycolicibacterium cosmeticum]